MKDYLVYALYGGMGLIVIGAILLSNKPKPKDCVVHDSIIAVADDYNGAWSGIDRTVYWKSGMKEITANDNSKYYVGKEICREWK